MTTGLIFFFDMLLLPWECTLHCPDVSHDNVLHDVVTLYWGRLVVPTQARGHKWLPKQNHQLSATLAVSFLVHGHETEITQEHFNDSARGTCDQTDRIRNVPGSWAPAAVPCVIPGAALPRGPTGRRYRGYCRPGGSGSDLLEADFGSSIRVFHTSTGVLDLTG